jgi:hypothetical protein
MDSQGIIDALRDASLRLGVFDQVNTHEPDVVPGTGVTCTWVFDRMTAVSKRSGLSSVAAVVVFRAQITRSLQGDGDAIDPQILATMDALAGAIVGDLDLGLSGIELDPLGAYGPPLSATSGYLKQTTPPLRVVTMFVTIIVDNAWSEVR